MDNNCKSQQAQARQQKAPLQAWRRGVQTRPVESKQCPHCRATVKASYVVCPECGRSLTPDKCSFCGACLKPGQRFCTHCGQSPEGVVCPECGTLNSRNFCRRCGASLTPMGQKALEAAKNDPVFRAVEQKALELAQLHERIEEMRQEAEAGLKQVELSEADKALLDEYADILGSIGVYNPKPKQTVAADSVRREYKDKAMDLDQIMAAYREKAQEMNDALAAMVPPPGFTPEQQRDYYSARKVATINTAYDVNWDGYKPQQWVCNFCGFMHNNPSECSEPQLGGVWIYVTPEEYELQNRTNVRQSLDIK